MWEKPPATQQWKCIRGRYCNLKDKPELEAVSPHSLLLLEQIGSLFPFGLMISSPDGIPYYQNEVFLRWMPDYRMENKLWFVQMQPYLDLDTQAQTTTLPTKLNIATELEISPTEIVVNWQNQRFFYRIKTSALYNEQNEICCLIEITENITDLRHLEFSLQQSRKFETVGRLASGIAHDFNNILQVINGHSEMLLDSYQGYAKLQKSLDVILTSGQKASGLTRQLLLFSRKQNNEFKLLSIGKMCSNMQKIISRMLGEDITMHLNSDSEALYFEGDESQVEQIIMNLAINARDAMPDGGKISITIDAHEIEEHDYSAAPHSKPGKYVRFQFSDTGIGMPSEVIEQIFEPFFTTKDSGHGTGLGLATVYSIVKQHRGIITVESELGAGTTFRIYFPLCKSAAEAAEAEIEVAVPSGGMEKVLIIEDDELVRDLAYQVLNNHGYQVQFAANLAQAFKIMESERFDLFLIDIVLPDGSGVDFIERYQNHHPDAAYILSSGYNDDKSQIKQTLAKGYTFLHKPYTISALLSACQDAMAAKKSSVQTVLP